jgi:hypothetical protein
MVLRLLGVSADWWHEGDGRRSHHRRARHRAGEVFAARKPSVQTKSRASGFLSGENPGRGVKSLQGASVDCRYGAAVRSTVNRAFRPCQPGTRGQVDRTTTADVPSHGLLFCGAIEQTHGRDARATRHGGQVKWTLSVGQRIGENKLIYGRGWRGRGEAPPPPLGLS